MPIARLSVVESNKIGDCATRLVTGLLVTTIVFIYIVYII